LAVLGLCAVAGLLPASAQAQGDTFYAWYDSTLSFTKDPKSVIRYGDGFVAIEGNYALKVRVHGDEVRSARADGGYLHRGFEKTYRLDLVCDHAVYDAKTVQAFVGEHDAQVLSYAMMLDIRHIKLLNFRPPRVDG
jgi:hypothetical protein